MLNSQLAPAALKSSRDSFDQVVTLMTKAAAVMSVLFPMLASYTEGQYAYPQTDAIVRHPQPALRCVTVFGS